MESSKLETEILRLSAVILLAVVVSALVLKLKLDINEEVIHESLRAEDLGSLEPTISETTAIPSKR